MQHIKCNSGEFHLFILIFFGRNYGVPETVQMARLRNIQPMALDKLKVSFNIKFFFKLKPNLHFVFELQDCEAAAIRIYSCGSN